MQAGWVAKPGRAWYGWTRRHARLAADAHLGLYESDTAARPHATYNLRDFEQLLPDFAQANARQSLLTSAPWPFGFILVRPGGSQLLLVVQSHAEKNQWLTAIRQTMPALSAGTVQPTAVAAPRLETDAYAMQRANNPLNVGTHLLLAQVLRRCAGEIDISC